MSDMKTTISRLDNVPGIDVRRTFMCVPPGDPSAPALEAIISFAAQAELEAGLDALKVLQELVEKAIFFNSAIELESREDIDGEQLYERVKDILRNAGRVVVAANGDSIHQPSGSGTKTMRTARLHFRNGQSVAVPVSETQPWPHALDYLRPMQRTVTLRSVPPSRVVNHVTKFEIDRATFDPDRSWQNYMEAD